MGMRTSKTNEIELLAFKIVRTLQNAGFKKTYFVGGYVRDKLLNLEFIEDLDIDIATEARPDDIKYVFRKEKFIEVGEAFNIIMLVLKGYKFEIATFREDIFEQNKSKWDGRYPKGVTFASAEDDARRRDFTINAIFFDPITKKHIDFVDGINDLKNKIIRTIGEPKERFREDYLRMLRAIRFAVQKNFRIAEDVLDGIKKYSDKIVSISKERILIELNKILLSSNSSNGLILLKETRLLKWLFLSAKNQKNIDEDNFDFAISCLKNAPKILLIRWVIFFQFLFYSFENLENIREKLIENKFDNRTIKNIIWILENKKIIKNWSDLPRFERMELLIHPQFENLFLFFKLEQKMNKEKGLKNTLYSSIQNIELFYEQFRSDKNKWKQMKKFTIINGNDLLQLGIKGKKIGEILKKIKKKYILDELKNREEIFKFLNEY